MGLSPSTGGRRRVNLYRAFREGLELCHSAHSQVRLYVWRQRRPVGWTGDRARPAGHLKKTFQGRPGGSALERLPSAQGAILETGDRVPHRAPCLEPASVSACVCVPLGVSPEQIAQHIYCVS